MKIIMKAGRRSFLFSLFVAPLLRAFPRRAGIFKMQTRPIDMYEDDSPALQRIIDQQAGSGVVRFPAGRYRVFQTLIVPSGVRALYGNGISLIGCGYCSTILEIHGRGPIAVDSFNLAPPR